MYRDFLSLAVAAFIASAFIGDKPTRHHEDVDLAISRIEHSLDRWEAKTMACSLIGDKPTR